LKKFYQKYRHKVRTQTRDTSEYGYHYLSGLLRMESDRTISDIARTADVAEQNMQQFISDSPWSGPGLMESLQQDIGGHPHYQTDSVLLIDESADEKAGAYSAGAGRQHNGRLGKVEMSQVGVFLSLTNQGYHTWVDGELYVPKAWFADSAAEKRAKVGLPPERCFQTKLELALLMVKRVKQNGLPFAAVDCDSLYGRKGWLRDEFDQLRLEYYADVPANTQVYLKPPVVRPKLTKKGKPTKRLEIRGRTYEVKQLKNDPQTTFLTLTLRPNERGMLVADFARRRVWSVRDDGSLRQEWLLIRQDTSRTTYSLSNAATDVSLTTMAHRKSQRYFIERSNQEAKSEFGWDEFQALKYRAWQHQLALTIMASWFITETRLEWLQKFAPDPQLLQRYETELLPNLSVANVRTLLRATMPLPQLTLLDAAHLVVKHLDNRSRSRKSRLLKSLSP
jgi:SRSO17 transposase